MTNQETVAFIPKNIHSLLEQNKIEHRFLLILESEYVEHDNKSNTETTIKRVLLPKYSIAGITANSDPRNLAWDELLDIQLHKDKIRMPEGSLKLHEYIFLRDLEVTDDRGWQYRSNWLTIQEKNSPPNSIEPWLNKVNNQMNVRRRIWFTTVVHVSNLYEAKNLMQVHFIKPLSRMKNSIKQSKLKVLVTLQNNDLEWIEREIRLSTSGFQIVSIQTQRIVLDLPLIDCYVLSVHPKDVEKENVLCIRNLEGSTTFCFDCVARNQQRDWYHTLKYHLAIQNSFMNFAPFDDGPKHEHEDKRIIFAGNVLHQAHYFNSDKKISSHIYSVDEDETDITHHLVLFLKELRFFHKVTKKIIEIIKLINMEAIIPDEKNENMFHFKDIENPETMTTIIVTTKELRDLWITLLQNQTDYIKNIYRFRVMFDSSKLKPLKVLESNTNTTTTTIPTTTRSSSVNASRSNDYLSSVSNDENNQMYNIPFLGTWKLVSVTDISYNDDLTENISATDLKPLFKTDILMPISCQGVTISDKATQLEETLKIKGATYMENKLLHEISLSYQNNKTIANANKYYQLNKLNFEYFDAKKVIIAICSLMASEENKSQITSFEIHRFGTYHNFHSIEKFDYSTSNQHLYVHVDYYDVTKQNKLSVVKEYLKIQDIKVHYPSSSFTTATSTTLSFNFSIPTTGWLQFSKMFTLLQSLQQCSVTFIDAFKIKGLGLKQFHNLIGICNQTKALEENGSQPLVFPSCLIRLNQTSSLFDEYVLFKYQVTYNNNKKWYIFHRFKEFHNLYYFMSKILTHNQVNNTNSSRSKLLSFRNLNDLVEPAFPGKASLFANQHELNLLRGDSLERFLNYYLQIGCNDIGIISALTSFIEFAENMNMNEVCELVTDSVDTTTTTISANITPVAAKENKEDNKIPLNHTTDKSTVKQPIEKEIKKKIVEPTTQRKDESNEVVVVVAVPNVVVHTKKVEKLVEKKNNELVEEKKQPVENLKNKENKQTSQAQVENNSSPTLPAPEHPKNSCCVTQ